MSSRDLFRKLIEAYCSQGPSDNCDVRAVEDYLADRELSFTSREHIEHCFHCWSKVVRHREPAKRHWTAPSAPLTFVVTAHSRELRTAAGRQVDCWDDSTRQGAAAKPTVVRIRLQASVTGREERLVVEPVRIPEDACLKGMVLQGRRGFIPLDAEAKRKSWSRSFAVGEVGNPDNPYLLRLLLQPIATVAMTEPTILKLCWALPKRNLAAGGQADGSAIDAADDDELTVELMVHDEIHRLVVRPERDDWYVMDLPPEEHTRAGMAALTIEGIPDLEAFAMDGSLYFRSPPSRLRRGARVHLQWR